MTNILTLFTEIEYQILRRIDRRIDSEFNSLTMY